MKKSLTINIQSQRLRNEKKRVLSTPIRDIDLEKSQSAGELVEAFRSSSIQARNLGSCARIFGRMLEDRERPTIILGLAGPLIAGGLRKVIRDMIHYGLVDVIVSTGAILYQDYYRASGYHHFKGIAEGNDARLRDLYIDRIYDTYVDEEKFHELDKRISHFADKIPAKEYSSRSFLELLSAEIRDEQSILKTALKKGVPIFCPALNDSSIGIGLTEHYYRAKKDNRKSVIINAIRDNYELTQIVVKSKRTAAVYVAGGVPKNFINDSIVMAYIFGRDTGGHKYAIQMTTDVPHWGGLSGSTLSEATSWGKINKEAQRQMVFVEPTVSLPLIVAHVLEKKYYRGRKKICFNWDNDILKSVKYKK